MRCTRALPLLLALALVAPACGGDDEADVTGPGSTTTTEAGATTTVPADEGEVVPSTVVVLAEGADADPEGAGPGLLVDHVDLRAFAGRFLVPGSDADVALRARADEVEDEGAVGTAWVGGVVHSGCAAPTGVELRRADDDLRLVPVGLPPDEDEVACTRAVVTVALVQLGADEVPDDATVAGEPASAPVGPGTVVGFVPLAPGERTDAVEITTQGQLVSFVADLEGGPELASLDLDEVTPDRRRFAFVIEACAAVTAELLVDAESIVAVGRQEGEERGEQVECEALEPYLVVADVAASASGGVLPEESG